MRNPPFNVSKWKACPVTVENLERAALGQRYYADIKVANPDFRLPTLRPCDDSPLSFCVSIPEIGDDCIVELVSRDELYHATIGQDDNENTKVTRYGWQVVVLFEGGGVGWEPPFTDEVAIVTGARDIVEAIVKARHAQELRMIDEAGQCWFYNQKENQL